MTVRQGIRKVLILGSGAIKIGEAGEFDYSGAQAIKALKEEGIGTVLVNPNIATIQTDKEFVDHIYYLPVTTEYVTRAIKEQRPDGILLGFGGQTALNCGMELAEKGILDEYGVEVLGTGIEAIEKADNREQFRKLMVANSVPVPRSGKANSPEEAIRVANSIGYPVMVRVAYTLGGQGSGVAYNQQELEEIVSRAVVYSRINQVLVEEYLGKWKEVEYEVLRDADDNCAIVCNMENFDPMGVHTGDSIVVAPSQTLNNTEYQMLRSAAFRIVRALNIIGECNVQYALNPNNEEYRVIEVNSRLSRSSALASKATGYPIAYIAAKIGVGYTLPELRNKVTGVTSAYFEPSLDYIVVKMPRWDFNKFQKVDIRIGTQMKSVGEVMAIGCSFPEAIQKAVRMVQPGWELTEVKSRHTTVEAIQEKLTHPSDMRLYDILQAYRLGLKTQQIHELTGIDNWFLVQLHEVLKIRENMTQTPDREQLQSWKKQGFSDKTIAKALDTSEEEIRSHRNTLGIRPAVRQIDTMAAEWPAVTNYLYTTYHGETDDIEYETKRKIIVLGSGCYRIGSSVEFDWCCVNMAKSLQKHVDEVIMVNYNPETVSTDYDVLDKLYFEEVNLERILDICDKEQPIGVVASVGGQVANNLALQLEANGVKILGTEACDIDKAEDRAKFSQLLDKLNVEQPPWAKLETLDQAKYFASNIGYPVLVRPSYVLSGSAMNVAYDENQLEDYLAEAVDISMDNPVVISKFILDSQEVEVDGVSDGENVFIGAIIEHIENAGVHSGDATMAIPSLTLTKRVQSKIRETSTRIALGLNIKGPFNIQYLCKDGEIYVIECNLRASRSMPFVSKITETNLMELAAETALGNKISPGLATPKRYGVKSPMFSFMRLEKAEPLTGVEMASTGEVACFGDNFREAFLDSLVASGVTLPKVGDNVLVTVGGDKTKAVDIAWKAHMKGFKLYATLHTAEALQEEGIPCTTVYKVSEEDEPNILDLINSRHLKLVINTPNIGGTQAISDGYLIRRKTVELGVPLITNLELAEMLIDML